MDIDVADYKILANLTTRFKCSPGTALLSFYLLLIVLTIFRFQEHYAFCFGMVAFPFMASL